jgi:hypothetical protein
MPQAASSFFDAALGFFNHSYDAATVHIYGVRILDIARTE